MTDFHFYCNSGIYTLYKLEKFKNFAAKVKNRKYDEGFLQINEQFHLRCLAEAIASL